MNNLHIAKTQLSLFRELFFSHIQTENLSDDEILKFSAIIDEWKPIPKQVFLGQYLRYGKDDMGFDKVYRITGTHTTQANLPPDRQDLSVPYALIGYENGIRIWVRPIDNFSAYQIDDIVSFENIKYKNTIANNYFSPNQFGWNKV